ncbi:hypothetical protein SAMN05444484_102110 [Flavobacterium chilense]|uniref:Uncharacterized protein n=1 Tax=Flavobacterium chilense TaxID=946677 RepID=A0A1M7CDE5_9FLAO|nr:hypothetical protein SAMN05444484_102110 [Flavobacterium chilense]
MNFLSKHLFEKDPQLKLIFTIVTASAILFFVGYVTGKVFYYCTH